ncbi:hypothetical protein EJK80_12075 [Corynebacterium phoceense]|uniref:Htaa domain-containing protein n=1 Tax=Corynebacterium phoceense TaxID=1686286 RepID=A0A540R451_9CORY|nr:HtaA domain-containing protein [Corynebacterium phoceense]TQE42519.1 hypothetical protein EJK80_12075 [Corynebacterium phoceense]
MRTFSVILRRILGTLAASTLIALPSVALNAPVASAAGTCSWNWGIKQSYRSYIQGQVAKGQWETDGIGFTGSETGADGAFTFTPGKASVQSDTVTVPFGGVIHFTGHNYGGDDLLDMTLTDWQIQASGNRAAIVVDYVSYESDMVDKSARGPQITGDNVVIARIDLDQPVDASVHTLDLSGDVTLTDEGHKLFIAYEAGQSMDPSSGTVATDGSCGGSSDGTGSGSKSLGTISGTFTGRNAEAMAILKETNDTMNGLTTFMGNTESFLDQLESFRSRTEAATGTTTSTTTSTTSGSGASGASTSSAASPSSASGSTSGTSGTTGATGTTRTARPQDPGSAASGGQSETCVATGVQAATAEWGVKKSFQSYITGSIAKGSWTLDGVGYDNSRFQFTGTGGDVDTAAQSGSIRYGGAMHFTGHNGVLDLNIANLEVRFNGTSGQLIADVRSSNMEGERKDFGRTVLGDVSFSLLDVSDSAVDGEATVTLTAAGNDAFANFYEPGTTLDPLSLHAQLGGSGDCAGASGTTAHTGAATTSGGQSAAAAKRAASESSAGDGLQAAAGTSTSGYEDGSGNFQIKKAAAAGSSPEASTWLLLLIAGLAIAGGSMGSVVLRNPA